MEGTRAWDVCRLLYSAKVGSKICNIMAHYTSSTQIVSCLGLELYCSCWWLSSQCLGLYDDASRCGC